MSVADPWCNPNPSSDAICSAVQLQFEDNFEPAAVGDQQQPRDGRLPDSDSYLAALGNLRGDCNCFGTMYGKLSLVVCATILPF